VTKIDIAIGQKVKFQGKHAVCAKYREGDCSNCILQATPLCATVSVPCEAEYRADSKEVYFSEVKEAKDD